MTLADPTPTPRVAPGGVAWDAEVLSRVRHLHLVARAVADRLLLGAHRSRRVGQAIEFADHQPYAPGMDPRRIDWRAAGRSDTLLVRRYETETEIPCLVVLDLSGDLATGQGAAAGRLPELDGTKAGFAITLAATTLAWLHRQGEPVGLWVVGGEGPGPLELLPRRGRSQLQRALLGLASVRPAGRAELAQVLVKVASRVRRRSVVVVVSDGMEEPSAWLPALQAFARRGADLRFVHVWDRAELTLDDADPALFYSPEGGDELAIDPVGARAELADVVAGWMAEVRDGVVAAGGRYVAAPTDRGLTPVVLRLVRAVGTAAEVP